MAVFNPRLQFAPVVGAQQVGMHLLKQRPNARVGTQPVAELLREHIPRRDAVPRLAGQFILGIARRWDLAKIHFRHIADFVIVVEHHPAVAGDAEVFKQHITGKDVGGGQLADSIPILFYRIA